MWVQKSSCMWKGYIWNRSTCSCENGKYLASIVVDSAIMHDESIESYNKETKLFQQISMKRRQSRKRKIFIFYLHFY